MKVQNKKCTANNVNKRKRCGQYSFKLMGKQKTYFKEQIVVDFIPKVQEQNKSLKTKNIFKQNSFPTFNNDRNYFTPSFIIPSIEKQKDQVMLEEHERRIMEFVQQIDINQIYIPKPRSKNQYCGVCREHYEDYLSHIMSEKHIQRLKNSHFQYFIMEEASKFKHLYQQSKRFQIGNDSIQQTLDEEELLNSYLDQKIFQKIEQNVKEQMYE